VDRGEVVDRVRELRARDASPKVIARAVGLPPSQVTPTLRALAEADDAGAAPRRVVGCWVNPGWSNGLSVEPDRGWLDDADVAVHAGGLVSVLVAREDRRGRVSVCGYLVDVYCLGVKNAIGPRVMDPHALDGFVAAYFGGYDERPVMSTLERAVGAGNFHFTVTAGNPRAWSDL
jgi:hypothetical protein